MDEWRTRLERIEEVVSHIDRAVEELSGQVRAAHRQTASLADRLARLERRLGVVEAEWDRKNAPPRDVESDEDIDPDIQP